MEQTASENPPAVIFDPQPPGKRGVSTVEDGRKILVDGLKGSRTCAELVL